MAFEQSMSLARHKCRSSNLALFFRTSTATQSEQLTIKCAEQRLFYFRSSLPSPSMPRYGIKTRGRDTPSVCAFRAACILGLIVACGFAGSLAYFIDYRTSSKDKNLDSLEGSIVDPIGIRWVVAISVTGGSIAVLVLLAIWLKLSYWSYEKRYKRSQSYDADQDVEMSTGP